MIHTFDPTELPEAIRHARERIGDAIKVAIRTNAQQAQHANAAE